MNRKLLRKYAFALFLGSTLFVSCSRDEPAPTPKPTPEPEPPKTETPDRINDFVWKGLNSWYYWQKDVPNLADSKATNTAEYVKLINGKKPDELFYSLLFNYGTTDLFSWIENDNEIVSSAQFMAEEKTTTGLNLGIFQKGGGSSNYVGFVTYVVPGTTAANAGVKRGDVITKVNGQHLTQSNYSQLFGSSFTITRAATATTVKDSSGSVTAIITTDHNEAIPITETKVDENPIAHYEVIKAGGKNIAYLVYNGFDIDYNDELNAVFGQMKADGVNELILDLRYNGGGSVETALGLGQMITGSFTDSDYIFMDFNDKHNNYDGFDKLSDQISIYNVVDGHQEKTGDVQTVNSLNLPKIYALVSFQTASASELTIIALKKLINVEVIGYATVGKFVGSHTLYDSPTSDFLKYDNRNKDHKWQMQPITFAYYNRDKDPHPTVRYQDGSVEPGILPSAAENLFHPFEWVGTVKEFGNPSDPELGRALELITGTSYNAKTLRNRAVLTNRGGAKILSKPVSAAKGLYLTDVSKLKKN